MKLLAGLLTLFLGAALTFFVLGTSLIIIAQPKAVAWQREFLSLKGYETETQLTASYLSGGSSFDLLSGEALLYTNAELSHLKDVRQIFDKLRQALGIAFLLVVFLLIVSLGLSPKRFLVLVGRSVKLGLLLVLGLLLASVTSFTFLFSKLHTILFPQGGFFFPSDVLLLQLFPEPFFRNAAFALLLLAIIILFCALGVVKLIEKR